MLCCIRTENGKITPVRIDQPITGRFPADCAIYESGELTVITEGCILNSEEQLERFGELSVGALVARMWHEQPDSLPRLFKGSFAAAVIDRAADRVLVFNDLLSKKPVYYYSDDEETIFATSFWQLADLLSEQGKSLTIDKTAVDCMLGCGSFIEDMTYVSQIRFLRPFCRLELGTRGLNIACEPYPVVSPDMTVGEAIEKIEALQMEANRLQYRKNERYGYAQVNSLSGGMDSRVVLEYGRKNGFDIDLTFTYAESGSDDMRISKRVAKHYGCKNRFNPLDGGSFIMNRDELAERNEGMIYYAGTTGLRDTIRLVENEKLGIVHAGIGGGEIMGDICLAQDGHTTADMIAQYLKKCGLSNNDALICAEQYAARYADFNTFRNMQDLRVCVNFSYIAAKEFDVASPFLDEDFFCFMLTVPYSLKCRRQLYREWYCRCIRLDIPVTYYGKITRQSGLQSRIRYITRRAENLLMKTVLKGRVKLRREMNPFAIWEKRNKEIAPTLRRIFDEDMKKLSGLEPELTEKLAERFSGDIFHKMRTLTATWALARLESTHAQKM